MKILLGLFLVVSSLLGTIFLRRLTGADISNPQIVYFIFITIGILGFWVILRSLSKTKEILENAAQSELESFKSTATKIELDFDHCTFKSGSYSHQVDDESITPFKIIASGPISAMDTSISETVTQSYLVYTTKINDAPRKFISHSFPFDQTTLKYYVLNNKIFLHIDKLTPSKYYFELIK